MLVYLVCFPSVRDYGFIVLLVLPVVQCLEIVDAFILFVVNLQCGWIVWDKPVTSYIVRVRGREYRIYFVIMKFDLQFDLMYY